MPQARTETVFALYKAALQGMTDDPAMEDCTVQELFSAALTLTNSFVEVLKAKGASPYVLRTSIEQLLVGLRGPSKDVY
jgi:hypothetical protein